MNPRITGSLSGIIGSGGNVGAVAFGLCFQQLSARNAFLVMGCIIVVSSILSVGIFIKGQSGLIWRRSPPIESKSDDSTVEDEVNASVVSKESEQSELAVEKVDA